MSKRVTTKELAEKHGISYQAVTKKMKRHGYKPDASGRYLESDFLRAQASGAEMDRAKAAAQLADAETSGDTLQAQKLRKQIRLLELDIEMSQAKLDDMLGKVIPVEKHKEHCEAIAKLMITWWDQASENAATKIKDASVLEELRRAGERARQDILDYT